MFKRIFMSAWLLCAAITLAQAQTASFSLQTSVTNIAGATTNSTAAPSEFLYDGQSPIRIQVSATGNAGTTNSAGGSGSLIVKFSLAPGSSQGVTNTFDTAAYSDVKITITNGLTSATVVRSDWFVASGASRIRVGQIENASVGSVSNIAVRVGYPLGQNR